MIDLEKLTINDCVKEGCYYHLKFNVFMFVKHYKFVYKLTCIDFDDNITFKYHSIAVNGEVGGCWHKA
jgi:predicted small secreted protein